MSNNNSKNWIGVYNWKVSILHPALQLNSGKTLFGKYCLAKDIHSKLSCSESSKFSEVEEDDDDWSDESFW